MKLLKSIWNKWLKVARIIGNFQAQVLFSLFYLTLLAIVGIALRIFSDPLDIKKSSKSRKTNFKKWEHPHEDINQARKQY